MPDSNMMTDIPAAEEDDKLQLPWEQLSDEELEARIRKGSKPSNAC